MNKGSHELQYLFSITTACAIAGILVTIVGTLMFPNLSQIVNPSGHPMITFYLLGTISALPFLGSLVFFLHKQRQLQAVSASSN